MFLAGDGGDECALAAAHVADDAHQLARPHSAAHVLQHDALRRQIALAVVHARRRGRRRRRPLLLVHVIVLVNVVVLLVGVLSEDGFPSSFKLIAKFVVCFIRKNSRNYNETLIRDIPE